MAPRLDAIKFNLMRAVELFEDMNHEDMDVQAPPSDSRQSKELQVAERLNECLTQLIRQRFFDDCPRRDEMNAELEDKDEELDYEGEDEESLPETPRSEGFSYGNASISSRESHDDEIRNRADGRRGSRESFTNRFKRYIERLVSSAGGSKSSSSGAGGSSSARNQQRHSKRSARSLSLSYERQADDGAARDEPDYEAPYDPSPMNNEHRHRHSIHDHHHQHQHQHQADERRASRRSSAKSSASSLRDYDAYEDSSIGDEELDEQSSGSGASGAHSRSVSIRSRTSSSGGRASDGRASVVSGKSGSVSVSSSGSGARRQRRTSRSSSSGGRSGSARSASQRR